MLAPRSLWKPFLNSSDRDFVVDGRACKGVQAVQIVMAPHCERVSVAMIDTAGRTKLTGELGPDDAFYYEIGDVRRISFSAAPHLVSIEGLSLAAEDVGSADLSFHDIAVIDARAWLRESLDGISERLTAAGNMPFVTITAQDWIDLQLRARALVKAIDAGEVPSPLEHAYVELALAHRWELAALAGIGFHDGEHVASPQLDRINAPAMLSGPSDAVYGYRILAEFDRQGLPPILSDVAFTHAQAMGKLTEARVMQRRMPRSRLVRVNQVDQVERGKLPVPREAPRVCTISSGSWSIQTDAPFSERVYTTPFATPSEITGGEYKDPSEFNAGDGSTPPSFRGFTRIEQRSHSFHVPYLDSSIWLALAVGDTWDRRVAQDPTRKVQPDVVYDGPCLPLATGSTAPKQGPTKSSATLVLEADPTWRADSLATFARARIELLIKDPVAEALEAEIMLFAPSPSPDGNWSADIASGLSEKELSQFVGGTLALDGFRAQILGFSKIAPGRFRCDFDTVSLCAGADLYEAGPKGIGARLHEEDGSDRVWHVAGSIAVQKDGSPGSSAATIELPSLDTSMTLYFSTRLAFPFQGRSCRGPTTARIAVPYLHPAPESPNLCVAVETLATDYYGRALIRVATTDCSHFDPALDVALELAEGVVKDVTRFSDVASAGLFGPQSAHDHRVLFEGFELLSRQAEGSLATLGLRYRRPSDGRESSPDLRAFAKRRTD